MRGTDPSSRWRGISLVRRGTKERSARLDRRNEDVEEEAAMPDREWHDDGNEPFRMLVVALVFALLAHGCLIVQTSFTMDPP